MQAPPPPLPADDLPGAVICFAGVTHRNAARLGDNLALALAGLVAAREWGMHGFFLSSAAVYGDPGPGPVAEYAPPRPTGAYGAAKLEMEHALLASGHSRLTILRLANVAGAGEPFDSARAPLPARLPLHRFADGTGPVRSFIGPASLALVLARLCALAAQGVALPDVLNVAAPRPAAMADILTALGRPWQWTPAPDSAIQTVQLDTARLAALCPLPADSGDARTLVREVAGAAPRP